MRERKFHMRKLPLASWLMILVALGSLCTGTVAAYLSYATKPVTNTFTPDQAETPAIIEETLGTEVLGLGVSVGDTGYTVYVRAAVVVNWEQGDKNSNSSQNEVLFHQPPVENIDYAIGINTTDWFLYDGFYYHREPVPSRGVTKPLVYNFASVPDRDKDGYFKEMEIVAQTIQALGTTDANETPAVTDAWGVYVDANGELTAIPPTT